MPFNITTDTGLCIPTYTDYENIFGEENSPRGRKLKDTGFLSMLRDRNFSIYTQLSDFVKGVPGKKKGVKGIFKQPMCLTVCTSDFDCNEERASFTSALKVFEYDIETRYTPCETTGSPGTSVPAEYKLTSQELAEFCEIEDANFVKEEIMDVDIEFMNQLDKTFLTIAETYVPAANELTRNIVVKNTLTNQWTLNNQWELMIESALTDAGLSSSNYVILGGLFTKMVQALGNSRFPIYYDVNADAILGKYSFLLIPRGAFQLVYWNDFVGSREFLDSDKLYEQSTKSIPLASGGLLPIDYYWGYEPKCGEFKYMPQLYAELVHAVPGTCDSLTQNGLFKFTNCTEDLLESCD